MADIVLLNTCSVRDLAEQKAIGKMKNLVSIPKNSKHDQISVSWVAWRRAGGGNRLTGPDVDLVVGTQRFHRVPDYLDEILAGRRETKSWTWRKSRGANRRFGPRARRNGQRAATAFVSIMQGCDQYCTFCIVPYTRGDERSRSIADIVEECRQLVDDGVKEITLLGQIVTSYGRNDIRDENGKSAFVQLLDAVHEVEGLERIRFTAPHPKGFGDDLVEAYARLSKLVEIAHLPVQSGCDRILKPMHRGYTRDWYLRIVEKLRARSRRSAISTDFIVGFPGETEDDFEQTASLMREVEFDQAYIFKYSKRQDTPAADMPDQIPGEVREQRHQRLLQVVNEIAKRKHSAFIGRQVQILVEGPSKRNPARMMGRTRCNKIVLFDGSERHRGQLMDVRITRAGLFTLYGDPAIIGLD